MESCAHMDNILYWFWHVSVHQFIKNQWTKNTLLYMADMARRKKANYKWVMACLYDNKPAFWGAIMFVTYLLTSLYLNRNRPRIIWIPMSKYRWNFNQNTHWCLMALKNNLNYCWYEAMWHSPESNFTVSAQATILYNEFENHTFEIAATSPSGHWVEGPAPHIYNAPTCSM